LRLIASIVALIPLAILAMLPFGVPAPAADLSVKAPRLAPAVDPGWTGFYLGGHAGYGWGDSNGTSFAGYPGANFDAAFAVGQVPRSVATSPNGAIGGGQIGYNYQVSPQWVVGLQADVSASGIKGSRTYDFAEIPAVAASATTHAGQSLDWLATVRGRIGYTFDRLMVFGSGGAAFGRVKSDFEIIGGPGLPASLANSTASTRTGWAAGAGTEYRLNSLWSVSVEWLHYDLGHVSFSAPQVTLGVPQPFGLIGTTLTRGDVVSAALNYRL
jgi:outer membrane immunogenic protein